MKKEIPIGQRTDGAPGVLGSPYCVIREASGVEMPKCGNLGSAMRECRGGIRGPWQGILLNCEQKDELKMR